MKGSVDIAAAIVRTWTRFYTWRVSQAVRELRLEEIESDLWELQHDPVPRGVDPSLHVLARLFMGVPADLSWRVEQALVEREPMTSRTALAAAIAILVTAFLILPGWYSRGDPTRRTGVEDCADSWSSMPALTRSDYRMQVIVCAGSFFVSRDSSSLTP